MIRPSIELLSHTPYAQDLIEIAGRNSYGSPVADTEEAQANWIAARIKGWEHDVLEHASATFLITCSRACSHQIVRHRIAAYTQQSQRFQEIKPEDLTLIPDWVRPGDIDEWLQDYKAAFHTYRKWRKLGYQRQQARLHLPEGTATRLIATWNMREIRHILTMRTPKKADQEFRSIAQAALRICLDKWPAVFADMEVLLA